MDFFVKLFVIPAPVGTGEPAAGQHQKDRAGQVPQHHKFGMAEDPFGDDATEDKKDKQKEMQVAYSFVLFNTFIHTTTPREKKRNKMKKRPNSWPKDR